MNIRRFFLCLTCMCFVIAGKEVTKKDDKNNKDVAIAANTTATKQNEDNEVKCRMLSHLCKPSGISVVRTLMNTSTVGDCQKSCNATKDCNFLTFTNFRNIATCHLLSQCEEKLPPCYSHEHCVSAPKTCSAENEKGKKCKKLEWKPDKGSNARWNCDSGNAYKEDIKPGTMCQASCPSWTNAEGQHISATSTCLEDGTWSPSQSAPHGSLMFPSSLPSPTDPDLPCTCPDLSLTYNPNTEAGTQFYCLSPNISLDQLPVTLTSTARCYLLCGFMLTATISCRDGQWSGNPEKGIWCSKDLGPLKYSIASSSSTVPENPKDGKVPEVGEIRLQKVLRK